MRRVLQPAREMRQQLLQTLRKQRYSWQAVQATAALQQQRRLRMTTFMHATGRMQLLSRQRSVMMQTLRLASAAATSRQLMATQRQLTRAQQQTRQWRRRQQGRQLVAAAALAARTWCQAFARLCRWPQRRRRRQRWQPARSKSRRVH